MKFLSSRQPIRLRRRGRKGDKRKKHEHEAIKGDMRIEQLIKNRTSKKQKCRKGTQTLEEPGCAEELLAQRGIISGVCIHGDSGKR
jgi:hypothetical protein